MFRSEAFIVALCLAASPAVADWSVVASEQLIDAQDQWTIRHEWSTATNSTAYDISACGSRVESRFDPSVSDSSSDAQLDVRLCRNSTDTWQRCRSVRFETSGDGTTWTPINAITPGENYIIARAAAATSGGDTARAEIRCTESVSTQSTTSVATDTTGMSGANMTWQTVEYMKSMTRFEGLDPTIPWTRYWIDPYSGSDSNAGTYDKPFKTLAKWKEMAAFGTWFTVKNGGRDRPMYISNQTYPYPAAEACVVGETVTYDGGSSTSKILDIDVAAGKIVFETLTGGSIDASDVITAGSQTGSACAWTLGTREPSIWDAAVVATYLCSIDNTDTCAAGQRYTTGAHCAVGTCVAAIEAAVALDSTPVRYDQRIVSMIDVEDPSIRPIIHGDSLTLGELDNTALGSNSDRNGLFITDHANSYGCLGVANFIVEKIIDDGISQHQEGCVRALNVYSKSILNVANGANNNVVTTHGGSSGRGGIVVVNGGGIDFRYADTTGAPVAPTGASHMILINGDYVTDLANTTDTDRFNIMGGTGGQFTGINVDGWCLNHPVSSAGCDGWAMLSTDAASVFNFIRSVARTSVGTGMAALRPQINSGSVNALTARFYRNSFYSSPAAIGIYSVATGGAISLDIKGTIFDGLDYYIYDDSNPASTMSGTVSGIYDNDGGTSWRFAATNASTAAAADALTPIDLLSDSASIQTDATEYVSGFGARCSDAGECFDSYTEAWSVQFPEIIYDYLPVPIYGYTESGTRNYGAR